MKTHHSRVFYLAVVSLVLISSFAGCGKKSSPSGNLTLLNVSYDPTREFYEDVNQQFSSKWKTDTGQDITINMSHGGSGKQARSVIDGLEADVVTLALAYDIDMIARKSGALPENWQTRLAHRSAPYTSTMVFLVRKGNPRHINDWSDLIRGDVRVITPNPKTSGAARWNYLAAWAYAKRNGYGDDNSREDFMKRLFANVPVLDSGARGSTNTFVQRGLGDVLVGWENEALMIVNGIGKDEYEIVVPSMSILAEPCVAVVDKHVEKHGTTRIAEAYLNYLYSPEGQSLAAQHFYRPTDSRVASQFQSLFPQLELVTIDEEFGGWEKATTDHFADGGSFDRIFEPAK